MKSEALYFNHTQQNCGVHEYGKLLAEKLAASEHFDLTYLEVSSKEEFLNRLNSHNGASVSFVNYHPETMSWLTKNLVQAVDQPVIGIMHEFGYSNAFYEGSQIFDFRALIDPSVRPRVANVTAHPRVVVGCRPSTNPRREFTVGSFGFGTPSKCFDHVVSLVKREFDEATIRFNIPPGFFCDPEGREARKIADACREMVAGTGITLEVIHEFLPPQKLVDFLAENTINLFVYTDDRGRGISSAVDFAVASGRPFGVSDGTMFRHLRHVCPEVFISKHGIKGILEYGDEPVKRLQGLWTDKKLSESFRDAALSAIESFKSNAERRRSFNTALDDVERARYSSDIEEMKEITPEIMQKKIAEANVQQAFVKSAVEHFAGGKKNLNILCVGSFEDTAYETLRKKGYSITAIDPAIDMDLDTFYRKKSTARSSFDIIFSTSVMEHVKDDELFVSQMADLLAVGGVAVLTTDFFDGYTEGSVKPYTDYRLYTMKDILLRLVPLMRSCELVGPHFWQRSHPDFTFEGAKYSFCSLVFRKNRELPEDTVFSDSMREELLKSAAALVPGLLADKERMDGEIKARDQAGPTPSAVSQHSGETQPPQPPRPPRLTRLARKIRKKLRNPVSSAKAAAKRFFGLARGTTKNVFKPLSKIAKKVRSKLSRRKRAKQALADVVATPAAESAAFGLAGPEKLVRLDGDYGMEEGKWVTYRELLLETPAATKLPGRARTGKLWICLSVNEPSDGIDPTRIAANIRALQGVPERPVGFMLLCNVDGGKPPLPGLNVTPVDSALTAARLVGDDESIIFTGAEDILDARMIRVLEERGAFAADLVLFDFYYVDGPRAYPCMLHGVDALHATHCDYFFSRFFVSAALLKQVTEGRAPLPLRDVAISCLSSAPPSSTAHIPVPLFRAGFGRQQVAAAKAAAGQRNGSRPTPVRHVSAIICTKDNHFLLEQLVWRLKAERTVKDIIVVSNNSSTAGMQSLLRQLESSGTATVLKYDKPFNFSEQCNLAARSASGSMFLFINDDIAPVNEDWLELLLESSAWNGGSISGPLLIYPNQTIQHGGMFLGFRNVAGHLLRHATVPDETSTFSLRAPRKVSSLTGAVLLVPRRIFEDMGGFDAMLALYAQDVDLCMRASGMGVDLVFDPRSVLIHFESMSVKSILSDDRVRQAREREFEYFRRRWPVIQDEWLNPNISAQDETMRSLIHR